MFTLFLWEILRAMHRQQYHSFELFLSLFIYFVRNSHRKCCEFPIHPNPVGFMKKNRAFSKKNNAATQEGNQVSIPSGNVGFSWNDV
jgi:hypothetical protein